MLLVLGVLGASAGVIGHRALADKRIDAPKAEAPPAAPDKVVEKTKPKPEKPFENAFGYTWFTDPQDFGGLGMGIWSIRGGLAVLYTQINNGDLLLVVASAKLQGKPGPIQFRPVVFDAERKRYLPINNVGATSDDANKAELNMSGYTLSAKDLAIEKVRYMGIEQLTAEGRKAIAARALERALKAGIEVLPPSHIGEVYDFTLSTLDGKRIRSRDLRGKVVLIDCWSSGWAQCLEKWPKLKQLYDKRHQDGFEIIGVCQDNSTAETVEKICAKKGLTWPQVLVPNDNKTHELWYETSGMERFREPRLLVIDRKRILRADCGPDQLEEEITKVLDK
jgi:peroxiredoxin